MKKLMSIRTLLTTILITLALMFIPLTQPAFADADIATGAKVFAANCVSCHIGGKNVVNAAKTLRKEALAQYAMNSSDAIVTQVTNGKGAMPKFIGRTHTFLNISIGRDMRQFIANILINKCLLRMPDLHFSVTEV